MVSLRDGSYSGPHRRIADSVGLKQAKGAVVTEATKGSPADKAGIKSGDIITSVDGRAIDDARALSRTIGAKAPGTSVEVTIWRNGAEQKVNVKLDSLTAAATDTAKAPAQPALALPCRTWPIARPSIHTKRVHHQTPGPNI